MLSLTFQLTVIPIRICFFIVPLQCDPVMIENRQKASLCKFASASAWILITSYMNSYVGVMFGLYPKKKNTIVMNTFFCSSFTHTHTHTDKTREW